MIEPALSPEEWRDEVMDSPSLLGDVRIVAGQSSENAAKILALANAALHDADARKISWQEIEDIRAGADAILSGHEDRCNHGGKCPHQEASERLEQFANALASYLPPRAS